MSKNQNEEQVELPGLELEPELGGENSPLRQAVIVTLKSLKKDGLLEDRHAAIAQLALELADAVAAGKRRGRASAAAMAAAQLLASLQALPVPIEEDVAHKFAEFVESLTKTEL